MQYRFPSLFMNFYKPVVFIRMNSSDPDEAPLGEFPDHSLERRAVGRGQQFRYRKVVATRRWYLLAPLATCPQRRGVIGCLAHQFGQFSIPNSQQGSRAMADVSFRAIGRGLGRGEIELLVHIAEPDRLQIVQSAHAKHE